AWTTASWARNWASSAGAGGGGFELPSGPQPDATSAAPPASSARRVVTIREAMVTATANWTLAEGSAGRLPPDRGIQVLDLLDGPRVDARGEVLPAVIA